MEFWALSLPTLGCRELVAISAEVTDSMQFRRGQPRDDDTALAPCQSAIGRESRLGAQPGRTKVFELVYRGSSIAVDAMG